MTPKTVQMLLVSNIYMASLEIISKPSWSSAPPSIATTPGKRITSTTQKSFFDYSISLWSNLSDDTKNSSNVNSFKRSTLRELWARLLKSIAVSILLFHILTIYVFFSLTT